MFFKKFKPLSQFLLRFARYILSQRRKNHVHPCLVVSVLRILAQADLLSNLRAPWKQQRHDHIRIHGVVEKVREVKALAHKHRVLRAQCERPNSPPHK